MQVLAIIPARAGSKRLKNKNILPMCGKPLIVHTIEKALKSKLITTLVVSTDGPKIKEISEKYCQVIMRPKKLARDTSSTYDVIDHVVKSVKGKFDIIVLLEPTSPLRTDDDIDKAIRLFICNMSMADSMVSLGEIQLEKPDIAQYINQKGYVQKLSVNKNTAYFPYGVIYLAKANKLLTQRTFYMKRTIPYFIQRWQNYEVDDIYDFLAIETIMKNHGKDKI